MEDSERAAEIARDHAIDAGLHLNLTSAFSASGISPQLLVHQKRVSQYLLRHRFSQLLFNPSLMRSFEYVVAAQHDEFTRLYEQEPKRLDGHHHMHLCANVLFGGLLPAGTMVRRSFSFQPGEKSIANRWYRKALDRVLSRRHRLTDFFFSIQPLVPLSRLQKIVDLSRHFRVELETHPQVPAEHAFLMGEGFRNLLGNSAAALGYAIVPNLTTQV